MRPFAFFIPLGWGILDIVDLVCMLFIKHKDSKPICLDHHQRSCQQISDVENHELCGKRCLQNSEKSEIEVSFAVQYLQTRGFSQYYWWLAFLRIKDLQFETKIISVSQNI